jgi:predicted small secreted protein
MGGDQAVRWISLALICLALSAGLGGCETVKGAGKDIEKAGEAIQRAAQ